MKANIINTNYIYDQVWYKVYRALLFFYGTLLILYTSTNFDLLLEYQPLVSVASSFFIGSLLLLAILNQVLQQNIGTLELSNNTFFIQVEGQEVLELALTPATPVSFFKSGYNLHTLKVNSDEWVLKFQGDDLAEFQESIGQFGAEKVGRSWISTFLVMLGIQIRK